MNILFLTIGGFDSIQQPGIFTDLIRRFTDEGHEVYVIKAREKRKKQNGEQAGLKMEGSVHLLNVGTGNITQSGFIEKGIATLFFKRKYISAVKRYFSEIKFDLILYSTPPITIAGVIKHLRKSGAQTYLLLKDIYPQNLIDLGILSKKGIKGLIYKYFCRQEKLLYSVSDHIGCTSPAGVDFVLRNNSDVEAKKVGVCANCLEVVDKRIDAARKAEIRKKYGIPLNKTIFVYGGNFGRPQGIDFIIDCLRSQAKNENSFFLLVGDGTEYEKIENYVKESRQQNLLLMKKLPVEEYNDIAGACDVGLIFIDWKYRTPGFPSRLLSYLQAGLPVLAATDMCSDIGRIIEENHAGYGCNSNDVDAFCQKICLLEDADRRKKMGIYAYKLLCEKYDIGQAYKAIMNATLEE